MASVALSILIASIDLTVVTTAMPKIATELNGFHYYTWPLVIYSLTMAVSIPLFGKMGDVYGFKPIYLFGLIDFLIGSLLCGMAPNMIVLIVFRAIQGVGGAILVANSLTVVGLLFEPAERAKYMGLLGTAGIAATIFGPTIGGWITDTMNWRWIFYINIPFILLGLIFTLLASFPRIIRTERVKIDYWGALELVLAVTPLLLVFTWGGSRYAWNSVPIIGMSFFTILMVIIFLLTENKVTDPVLPLRFFKNGIFNTAAIEMFLINAILGGVMTFAPLFMQSVLGYSSQKSGGFITPMMISMVVTMIAGGVLVSKTHRYKLQTIVGIAVIALGCVMLAQSSLDSNLNQLTLALIVFGAGAGLAVPIFTSVAQSAFSENDMGAVTGDIQFFKTLGQTIGPSLLSTFMAHDLASLMKQVHFGALPQFIIRLLKNPDHLTDPVFFRAVQMKLPHALLPTLNTAVHQLKNALAASIQHVFWITLLLSLIAFAVSIAMKEIKLKQKD